MEFWCVFLHFCPWRIPFHGWFWGQIQLSARFETNIRVSRQSCYWTRRDAMSSVCAAFGLSARTLAPHGQPPDPSSPKQWRGKIRVFQTFEQPCSPSHNLLEFLGNGRKCFLMNEPLRYQRLFVAVSHISYFELASISADLRNIPIHSRAAILPDPRSSSFCQYFSGWKMIRLFYMGLGVS